MTEVPARLSAAVADRYRIERELGAGGMAIVYLAEDLKHHRKVALKVLRPDLTATVGPERFVREVSIAANLTHPHILPLHDSGEADGFLYYVMPYAEGPSVREKLIREGELPITEAVRILRDVADAIAYAHRQGVVHRDIKPENIMLAGRHALVTDFGVAKAVSEATGRQSLTTVGVALGTPAYMAPEQAAADPHTDHRADIYAWGILAYELLTGRPPFERPTPQAVLAAHVTEAAEPVTRYRTSIPAPLAAMVMKALEKKPADRWQTADELVPQLESLLTPSGGTTPTATQPVPAAMAPRRSRLPVLGAAAVITVAVVGALMLWGGRARGAAPRALVAVLPLESRSTDSSDVFLAEGLSEQVGSRLSRLGGLRVSSAAAVAAQWRRTPDPLEAARALGVEWIVTGSLRRSAAELSALVEVVRTPSGVQAWSSVFRRAGGDFATLEREIAESVAVALVGTVAPAPGATPAVPRASSGNEAAYRSYLLGHALLNRRTPETVAKAVEAYAETVRLDTQFASAWARLGQARLIQYSWKWQTGIPRDSVLRLGWIAAERALAIDSLSAGGWAAVGSLATWTDDFARGRTSLARALRLDSLNPEFHHSYGVLLGADRLNDFAPAEAALRRSLALDPNRPNTWRHLAWVKRNAGRLPEAQALLDTTLALGPWAPAFGDRAYLRYLRGDGTGALTDLAERERLEGQPDDTSRALYRVAVGDSSGARAWLVRKSQPQKQLAQLHWVARMSAALGRRAEALNALERLPKDGEKWVLLHDPAFWPLRDDPRFRRMREATDPEP